MLEIRANKWTILHSGKSTISKGQFSGIISLQSLYKRSNQLVALFSFARKATLTDQVGTALV